MKVEIIKKAPEPKKDVPFVVGGVYKRKIHENSAPDMLVLVQQAGYDDRFAFFDPATGRGGWAGGFKSSSEIESYFDSLIYCPNARLVIEE